MLVRKNGKNQIFLKKGFSGNIYKQLLKKDFIQLNSIMIKKECLSEILFDTNLNKSEDWDFLIRLSKLYEFVYIDKILAVWNRGDHSRISNTSVEARIRTYEYYLQKYDKEKYCNPAFYSIIESFVGHNYCMVGDTKRGRGHLFKALRTYPFNYKAAIALFMTSIGNENYKKIFNMIKKYRVFFKYGETIVCSSF